MDRSKIRKEQIVQLREHDLNRGKNKSNRPVYPKTVIEAVIGADSLSGVIIVDSLPASGEIGKIYYSTENGTYFVFEDEIGFKPITNFAYVSALPETGEPGVLYLSTDVMYGVPGTGYPYFYLWNGNDYVLLNTTTIVGELNEDMQVTTRVEGEDVLQINNYKLRPDYFYNITDWDMSEGADTTMTFVFSVRGNPGVFAGRFIAWADDMNITWPTGVIVPESAEIPIVANHIYEFSVWLGVLLITDVTPSQEPEP